MKQTRTFRRILSFLLTVTMLLSVAVVGIAGVSAADELAINYSYKYQNAGYAEGRIELTGSADDYGTYYLYWADDTKALDGYAAISTVELNSARKIINLAKFTAIPADATKIIAVKGTAKTVADANAVYDIPEAKQFGYSSSDVEYNFQTLSDIHIHKDNYYTYAETHFASALNAAAKRDAEFVSTCGDQTNYGEEKEWNVYLSTIANSNFTGPVYEVTGNHEDYGKGTIPNAAHTANLNRFKTATGLNVVMDKMQSELYYEMTAPNGDHHIYMSLELVNNEFHPGISDNFTKAQMDWLEELLNKYKNDGKKIFIYEHAPFKGYGAGDNKVTPHYEASMTIDKDLYPQTYRFKELLEANKDIVWFSGHTHIDFKYNYNIDNENGTSAYSVHVPSSASTTLVNASGGLDRPQDINSAQGYFVDVYADATVLNGTDLVKNEILPLYTYLVDYTGSKVDANPDYKELEDLYDKVSVTVDVKALLDAPAAVKVSLYGAEDEGATSVVEMTKNADGTYTAQVSSMYTKMKFLVNNGTVDIKSAEYPVAESNVALGVYKIKYNNDQNWANVNIYAWSDVGGDVVTWPGMAMTKEADGTYTAVIPNYPNKVIFNDGTNQTDDLDIAPYIVGSEQPSQPTQPTTTEPDVIDYIYGDADMNGVVNIKDATTVQKYAADMLTLEEVAFIQANVTGDAAVNVRDATAIQKWIAGLITSFAVEADKDIVEVSASADEDDTPAPIVPAGNVAETVAAAKNALANEKYYASYVAYANLKKAYFACKDKDVSAVTAEEATALTTALADYNEMKKNNPSHIGGTFSDGGNTDTGITEKVTVYFEKPADWADAYIYLMDASQAATGTAYPGDKMTLVEGSKYSFEVPAGTGYIKFVDGPANLRTENVPAADIVKDRVYSIGASSGDKKWYATWDGAPPTPVPGEEVTVYFINSGKWANVNAYIWTSSALKTWPGEPATKTDKQVNGFDVYSYTFDGKYANIIFNGGDGQPQTDDLTVSSVAGKYYYLKDKTAYASLDDVPQVAPPSTEKITVYFIKPDDWDDAYIHLMNSDLSEFGEKYPGYKMTLVEGNKYSFEIPEGVGAIKFKNSWKDETSTVPNLRTENIEIANVVEGRIFRIGDETGAGTGKWYPAWD